jgi:hypothetical protein
MSEAHHCPRCGAPLRADAAEGLCPGCLLSLALHPTAGATARPAGFEPPEPAALAPHFPHLEIQALLGRGGMGAVYKARHLKLDRLVALKILAPEAGRDPAFAERFLREARVLARLDHPGIVAVYDFGESGGLYFLVMQLVEGTDLRQVLRAGRVSPREALAIVPQLCEALQYAHDHGVVHRDVKPENILLDSKGRVKVADFGLAKLAGPAGSLLTGSGQVMGTPHYMAPEQVERPLEVDHRADIYSLGVVFYELLTGELPLGRFPPPSRKVEVDVRLDEVILRTLEKEPQRRYQHASEVKVEVESIPPPPAPGPTVPAPPEERPSNDTGRQWQRWPMLGVVGWLYFLSMLLPALEVRGRITSGPGAGGPVGPITLSGWSCFCWGWQVQSPSWYANPVLWLACLLLALRRSLWAGLLAQAAIVLALLESPFSSMHDCLGGYWLWLTSMAALSGFGFYGWWHIEGQRRVSAAPDRAARRLAQALVLFARVGAVVGLAMTGVGLALFGFFVGEWLPDPLLLLAGLAVFGFAVLCPFLPALGRRLRDRYRHAAARHPGLGGLVGLLVCLNAAALLIGLAFTRPVGSISFSWRTGNEAELAVKKVVYEIILPFLLGYPWPILLASAVATAGVLFFVLQRPPVSGSNPGKGEEKAPPVTVR